MAESVLLTKVQKCQNCGAELPVGTEVLKVKRKPGMPATYQHLDAADCVFEARPEHADNRWTQPPTDFREGRGPRWGQIEPEGPDDDPQDPPNPMLRQT